MSPNNAEKNAQKYFRKADQSESLAKDVLKAERTANTTKITKLRELRLARDAAETLAAGTGQKN